MAKQVEKRPALKVLMGAGETVLVTVILGFLGSVSGSQTEVLNKLSEVDANQKAVHREIERFSKELDEMKRAGKALEDKVSTLDKQQLIQGFEIRQLSK